MGNLLFGVGYNSTRGWNLKPQVQTRGVLYVGKEVRLHTLIFDSAGYQWEKSLSCGSMTPVFAFLSIVFS